MFHLAATWLLHCRDFPRTAFHVTIEGTFKVLEACARHRVEKRIRSSSASLSGSTVEVWMREDQPSTNRKSYGPSRMAGEEACTA